MKSIIALSVAAALLTGSPVQAEPAYDVNVTVATYHGGDGEFNDFNPGVIGRIKPSGDGLFFFAGAYKNSDINTESDDYSLTGGVGYEWEVARDWIDVSLSAGFATGYTVDNIKTTLPVVTPSVVIKDLVVLNFVPVMNNDGSLTAGVNLAFRVFSLN
jgi:hypothetical protein